MCKLILGIKNEGKNDDFANAVKAQFEVMNKERDGIGSFIKTKDGVRYMRSLENYKAVYEWVVKNIELVEMVGIHTRTMSTGKVCLRNCHFFENDGFLFAHNGFAHKFKGASSGTLYSGGRKLWSGKGYEYGTKIDVEGTTREYDNAIETMAKCAGCKISYKRYCKTHKKLAKLVRSFETGTETNMDDDETSIIISEDPNIVQSELEKQFEKEKAELKDDEGIDFIDGKVALTDSEMFSKTLIKPFTLSDIRKHVIETQFSGMGVLVDGKTGESFLLAYKKCYVLKGEDYAIFCSYDPEETYHDSKFGQVCGVLYEDGEEDIPVVAEKFEIVEGTYNIKPSALK